MIIGNKYEILNKLGSGSFGTICKGINVRTKEQVAIKIEQINSDTKMLKHETKVYQYLLREKQSVHDGIPQIKWFGLDDTNYYMVIELLGESLFSLKQKCNTFSLQTTIAIGIKVVKILKFIHEKGLIHRDIKPDNFLVGLQNKKNEVYIIDFGFCRKYINDQTNKHIEQRHIKNIIGTPNFISVNMHQLQEPSRRDDIESVMYMLIYFYKGRLPWEQVSGLNEIKQMKQEIISNSSIPEKWRELLLNIRKMQFKDAPEYNYIINMLKETI